MNNINAFPDEILENIFYLLSPYRDIPNIKRVCRRWFFLVAAIEHGREKKFQFGIINRKLTWTYYIRPNTKSCITSRFSHSSCYHDKILYIFGGCTSTSTTFNDLWKFDLTINMWIRPIISGSYPSPKAWATMVSYKNDLILYGGWSPSLPNNLHQSPKFFNELHTYSVAANSWKLITTYKPPSGRAGHMSTIFCDSMVVFGGCCAFEQCTDEIWVLNLINFNWENMEVSTVKPLKRYSHGQTLIKENYLLIVGGYGGANRQYNDVWLLNMSQLTWQWTEISVLDLQFSTPQLWCHPVCMVGDFIIILGKNNSKSSQKINLDKIKKPKENEKIHNLFQKSESSNSINLNIFNSQPMEIDTHCIECPVLLEDANTNSSIFNTFNMKNSFVNTSEIVNSNKEISQNLNQYNIDLNNQEFLHDIKDNILCSAMANDKDSSSDSGSESFQPKLSKNDLIENTLFSKDKQIDPLFYSDLKINSDTVTDSSEYDCPLNESVLEEEITKFGSYSSDSNLQELIHDPAKIQELTFQNITNKLQIVASPNLNLSQNIFDSNDGGAFSECSKTLNNYSKEPNIVLCSQNNVNNKRENYLPSPKSKTYSSSSVPLQRPRSMNDRQHRLYMLEKYEEKYRKKSQTTTNTPRTFSASQAIRTPLLSHSRASIYTLDLRNLFSCTEVKWMPPIPPNFDEDEAPEELNFYSIVETRGEVIIFGGVASDRHTMQKSPGEMTNVTDSLYFLSYGKHIF